MSENRNLKVVGLLLYGFYLLGVIFPDVWWATHFIAFMPNDLKYLILITAPLLLFFVSGEKLTPLLDQKRKPWMSHGIVISLALLMGYLMHAFPMVADGYGEAYLLNKYLDKKVEVIPQGTKEALLHLGVAPWDGQKTILAMITYIAHYIDGTYKDAFYTLNVVCGTLLILVWLYFVRFYQKNTGWRIVLVVMGLTSPYLLNYFGHIEINAPVFLVNMIWMALLATYMKTKNDRYLWALLPMLFLCLKMHPVAILFIPTLGLLFLRKYTKKSSWFHWKGVGMYFLVPIFTIGAIVYFFVLKDYNDPRYLWETAKEYDRIFLPIIPPDAPLDQYHMLSSDHFLDYFQELFIWTPIGLLLMILIGLSLRKKIEWNAPVVLACGLVFILFASLFFVVNPLLSMQMDWDLFSMPTPVLMVLLVVLSTSAGLESYGKKLIGASLMLALLSVPFFTVHFSHNQLSHRLESAGIRIFNSYYEWANQTMRLGLSLSQEPEHVIKSRKYKLLEKLVENGQPGIDYELGRAYADMSGHYLRQENILDSAIFFGEKSTYYYPDARRGNLYLMEAYFMKKEMQSALNCALALKRLKYPNEKKAIRIVVHVSLECQDFAKALENVRIYNQKWSGDQMMQEVQRRLETNDRLPEIRLLFGG